MNRDIWKRMPHENVTEGTEENELHKDQQQGLDKQRHMEDSVQGNIVEGTGENGMHHYHQFVS